MFTSKRVKELQEKIQMQLVTTDRLEMVVKEQQEIVKVQQKKIHELSGEIFGNTVWELLYPERPGDRRKTRIDAAIRRLDTQAHQIKAICDHLEISLRGKDEMPEYDVVEKEEESE